MSEETALRIFVVIVVVCIVALLGVLAWDVLTFPTGPVTPPEYGP